MRTHRKRLREREPARILEFALLDHLDTHALALVNCSSESTDEAPTALGTDASDVSADSGIDRKRNDPGRER